MLAQALAAHRRGELETARRLYAELLAAQPAHADALQLLAVLDYQQGRPVEALAGLDRALALAPGLATAWSNRAAVLRTLGRAADALASAEQALRLQPDDAGALNNRAAALLDLGRPEAALEGFERVLARDATRAESRAGRVAALAALGEARLDAGRGAEGLALLRRALELAPDTPFLLGRWLHAKLKLCDWEGLDQAGAALAQGIAAGRPVAAPFVALHLPLSRAQQQRCARIFSATLADTAGARPPPAPPAADGRLRVGFFSADLRDHATARLMVGLIEHLRRDRVEATAFAFGPQVEDPMRARLRVAFEHFIEVSALSDEAVVQRARQQRIDIAIDLGGPTRDGRPGLFARRVAPLQLGWLGFAGTQGAPWIDALIADATVAPPSHAADYDEVLVRLPHSYQANDDRRPLAAAPARAAAGLPAEGFVFAALLSPDKIEPGSFDLWMRLLRQRPGSVLWLLQPDPAAAAQLRAQAGARGVDPARLVFAPRLPPQPHLARLRCADLALDSLVCNGHTSTSDALWAGVPVLTRLGGTFAARVAASLLRAAGLPELVTADSAAYEALALELSAADGRLRDWRARLQAQRRALPLFDAARFARAFEAALSALWQRHAAGRGLVPLQVLEDALGDLRVVEQAAVTEAAGAVQAGGGQ